MSHLMSSTKMIEENEGLDTIEKISIGTPVVYHARYGAHRQGRERFPALVLMQHPDDGTLDMIVFYEPEDMIWERRVKVYSEQEPYRCWSPIDREGWAAADGAAIEDLGSAIRDLHQKVFGDYNDPPKSVMDHLADFDRRLSALEAKAGKKGK